MPDIEWNREVWDQAHDWSEEGDEWSGMAVHIGARIGAMAGPDEVLTSRTVRDLSAGSGLRFESVGLRNLKGIADETEVFRVTTRTGVPF